MQFEYKGGPCVTIQTTKGSLLHSALAGWVSALDMISGCLYSLMKSYWLIGL